MCVNLEQKETNGESLAKFSGGFGAVSDRENYPGAHSGCGSQGCVRLTVWIGDDGRFGSSGRLHGDARRVRSDAGLRFFLDAHQALIRNLPAEVAVLAALLEILLEEDGAAGIGDKNAGSGQKDIASAVLHFHTTPEKG